MRVSLHDPLAYYSTCIHIALFDYSFIIITVFTTTIADTCWNGGEGGHHNLVKVSGYPKITEHLREGNANNLNFIVTRNYNYLNSLWYNQVLQSFTYRVRN